MNVIYIRRIFDFISNRFVNAFFPFGISIIAARALSPSDLGFFFISLAASLWISIFVDFGLIRHGAVIVAKGLVGNYAELLAPQFLVSCVIVIVAAGASSLFHRELFHLYLFAAAYGSCIALVPRWYYQAKGEMFFLTKLEAFLKLLVLAALGISIVLEVKVSVLLFEAALLLSAFFTALACWIHISRHERFQFFSIELSSCVNNIKISFSVLTSRLAGNLTTNSNVIILGFFAPVEAVAVYSICERCIKFAITIIASISEALYPSYAEKKTNGLLSINIKLTSVASILAIVATLLAGKEIIALIFSMPAIEFENISIMSVSILFYSLSASVGLFGFISQGRYKLDLASQLVIGPLSIVTILVSMIYFGGDGAYYSFLINSAVSLGVILLIYKISLRTSAI